MYLFLETKVSHEGNIPVRLYIAASVKKNVDEVKCLLQLISDQETMQL